MVCAGAAIERSASLRMLDGGGGGMCHDESCRQRVRASLAGLDLYVLIDGYISSVGLLAHVPA